MRDISEMEFRKKFMKNLFKHLLNSYIVEDKNLKKIIAEGTLLRTPEFEKEIQLQADFLADSFLMKFSNEQEANEIIKDEAKLKRWVTEIADKIG